MTLNINFDAYALSDESAIVVGVSGGSDSLALLLLLQDYLSTLPKRPRLVAVTVDHDLRAESASEARYVAALCKLRGIEHHISLWEGDKPATGVPDAARKKRYQLLVEAAAKVGACRIFTGHTLDDQIETYLMRKERGAAVRGLAVMAEHTRLNNQFILTRPLLSKRRENLREFLSEKNIDWVDDPTNVDLHYERPRMRIEIKHDKQSDQALILAQINQAQKERSSVNAELAAHLIAHKGLIHVRPDGAIDVEKSGTDGLSADASALLFGILASLSGGKKYLPRPADMRRILHHLKSDRQKDERINIHGSVIERRAKYFRFWRENRHLPELRLDACESAIWDGRYHIKNYGKSGITVRSLDKLELQKHLRENDANKNELFFPALVTMPAIICNNIIIGCTVTDSADSNRAFSMVAVFSLFDHVLTGHDFELAAAVKAACCAKTRC